MTPGRSVIVGLAAGAAMYAGLSGLGHFSANNRQALIAVSVSPSMSPGAKVTAGAKTGAKSVSPLLSPVLSPGAKVTKPVTPTLSPSVSPVLSQNPTPIPYTTVTPSLTPTPIEHATPSPTQLPTPTPTPSDTPSPTLLVTTTPLPATSLKVAINEIAWMGTEASSTDEWVELYNYGTEPVDLTGWKISIAGDNAISLSGQITAGGYYLLERTDDSPVSDVAADYTGSFGRYGLSDSGEHLTLTDSSGVILDEVDCSAGWFAGIKEKGSRASMERINPASSGNDQASWAANDGSPTVGHDASGQPILGTPRAANSVVN